MKISIKKTHIVSLSLSLKDAQWTSNQAVAKWFEQFPTSASIKNRIEALQLRNARQNIER